LNYGVLNLNDAAATLGGFPYSNRDRQFSKPGKNDIDAQIPRIDADPAALAEIDAHYQATGRLQMPLVSLHTTLDPQVPYAQSVLYLKKTKQSGAYPMRHIPLRIPRYGHCSFTSDEALFALLLMGFMADDPVIIQQAEAAASNPALGNSLLRLAQSNGLRFRFEKGRLRLVFPRK
jgi:hypothetical protein